MKSSRAAGGPAGRLLVRGDVVEFAIMVEVELFGNSDFANLFSKLQLWWVPHRKACGAVYFFGSAKRDRESCCRGSKSEDRPSHPPGWPAVAPGCSGPPVARPQRRARQETTPAPREMLVSWSPVSDVAKSGARADHAPSGAPGRRGCTS